MTLPSPAALRSRHDRLLGRRAALQAELVANDEALRLVEAWLANERAVAEALDQLSRGLFEEITQLLEQNLTLALQDVLEQGLKLKVKADYKRGAATISFSVERDGNAEDILRGMGGSVANVLSVGLRLFALTTLDETSHRRFLLLDEQDCWISPEILPRFVRIIRDAGRALGFQILVISHHDPQVFAEFADRITRIEPGPTGVRLRVIHDNPPSPPRT